MNGVNNNEQTKYPQNRSGRALPRNATRKQSTKYKNTKIIIDPLNRQPSLGLVTG
jgi:hypothetical protein